MERKIRLSREALDRAGAIIRLRGKLTAAEIHSILTDEGIECPSIPVLQERMEAWERVGAYGGARRRTLEQLRPQDN